MYDYSLQAFGDMINHENRHRVDAYVEAMKRSITPDSVVLELGTGVGFFALLACQLGARHVYAVEPNPLIQMGQVLAQANGLANRITFMQEMSSNISLPEPADVMVSDIRGALPFLADHIPCIVDARKRLLKPGAVQIPHADSVWAAVAHAPKNHAKRVAAWDENRFGLNLEKARARAVNTWGKGHIKPEALLTSPACWATLDYPTVTEPDAKGTIEWTLEQSGTGHGLSLWFESELIPGVPLSNSPYAPHNPIYSQLFFPWEQPVELAIGDQVAVTLQTKLVENRYEWMWQTRIQSAEGETRASYRQSTFHARVWSSDLLRQHKNGG